MNTQHIIVLLQHIEYIVEAHRIFTPAERWWWLLRSPKPEGPVWLFSFSLEDKMWINNIVPAYPVHLHSEKAGQCVMEGEGTVCVCMCGPLVSLVANGKVLVCRWDDLISWPKLGFIIWQLQQFSLKPWHETSEVRYPRTFKCIHGSNMLFELFYLHCCLLYSPKSIPFHSSNLFISKFKNVCLWQLLEGIAKKMAVSLLLSFGLVCWPVGFLPYRGNVALLQQSGSGFQLNSDL